MHLKEIVLRNWRSYRSARFCFPDPKERKKVLLIGAMNATGKTSLLMALYLGMFGREAMQNVEGISLFKDEDEKVTSYRKLLQRILHRPAVNDDYPQAAVELVFIVDGEQITITRTWNFTRSGQLRTLEGDGEEVRLEVNGRPRPQLNWQEMNNQIARYTFPLHVMPCFFFDGEQAQKRVEATGAEPLRQAVNALFGMSVINELENSLKNYISVQRSSTKREIGDIEQDELERLRVKRDQIEDDLKVLAKEITVATTELSHAEEARKSKVDELTHLTGDASIDLRLLSQKRLDLSEQERQLRSQVCQSLAGLAIPMALRKHGIKILSQLKGEILRDKWLLLKDETLAKADQIIENALPKPEEDEFSPPLTIDQYNNLRQRIARSLESLWNPPPKDCAEAHQFVFLGSSDRTSTSERLQRLLGTHTSDVVSIARQWEQSQSHLTEIQRRWDQIQDVKPRIQDIKTRLEDLEKHVNIMHTKKWNLESREKGLQSELKDLKATIGQMEGIKRRLGPVEQKLDLAERVREVFRDTRDQLIDYCKDELAETTAKHFRQMISGEYCRARVEFDYELQPYLKVPGGKDDIYVSTLSGAQKRAFGLAFTLAVAEVSGQEAPIVIDTPVGNMDSEFRKRVLKYIAQNAPSQLIFLSHDEEIYGEYESILDPYVQERFVIECEKVAEGVAESSVCMGKYFSRNGVTVND